MLLPNFGDEKGVADTLKMANLDVPVLIQAYPDELSKMNVINRRDSWCGKISVCNNLYQYGIKYSLTSKHVISPSEKLFQQDLLNFVSVCRVVKGLRNVRIGAVGARPGAFNTVRYSEKILQRNGITVTTVDLSEILGKADKLNANDTKVKQHLEAINTYAPKGKTPDTALVQMAKLDVVLNEFVEEYQLDATAIQCWTSLQQNFGCNVCTSMSIMTLVILTKGIDLSVGSILAFAAAVTAGLLKNGIEIPSLNVFIGFTVFGAIWAGLMVGGALGLFNGWMITRFKVPPFVATLAMSNSK